MSLQILRHVVALESICRGSFFASLSSTTAQKRESKASSGCSSRLRRVLDRDLGPSHTPLAPPRLKQLSPSNSSSHLGTPPVREASDRTRDCTEA
jgi:hypothetical protein